MAENENVAELNEVKPAPEKPPVAKRIVGGVKEWLRKFTVNLKRRPMNIAFFVLLISTVVNLCCLSFYSQLGMSNAYSQESQGLCVFIGQLFSILVLLLFMNSFPKRAKKPKIVMLVLTFLFMAVLLALDIYLYIQWGKNYAADVIRTQDYPKDQWDAYWVTGTGGGKGVNTFYPGAMGGVLAHIILVGLAAVLTATYPLYGKLINMINTRKVVESTELKEAIDTSEE